MKEELMTDALLRQFLLGKVDDEERQQIEHLFITDSSLRERVLGVEQDLIEDYLEDSLTPEDKEIFLSRYANTPEQRRKLRITKSIKDWAVTNAAAGTVSPPATRSWSRWLGSLRLKPIFMVPIAVTLLIAVVISIVWLNSRGELRNRHLALEQELARLNSPAALGEALPRMTTLELAPVSVRSVAPEKELNRTASIQTVELHLAWIQPQQYPTYNAVVRRVGDDKDTLTVTSLQAENEQIHLRLPITYLTPGTYRIELTGITTDGASNLTEEYVFTVGG
jgi:hypothetical protein